jgi:hypothetical protein
MDSSGGTAVTNSANSTGSPSLEAEQRFPIKILNTSSLFNAFLHASVIPAIIRAIRVIRG